MIQRAFLGMAAALVAACGGGGGGDGPAGPLRKSPIPPIAGQPVPEPAEVLQSPGGSIRIGTVDYCGLRGDGRYYVLTFLESTNAGTATWQQTAGPAATEGTLPFQQDFPGNYDATVQANYTAAPPAGVKSTIQFDFEATDNTNTVTGVTKAVILPTTLPTVNLGFAACSTEARDIDLFVTEPSGSVVSIITAFNCSSGSCVSSPNGGYLLQDVLDGQAPEVITYPGTPANGTYCLGVRNFSDEPTFIAIRAYQGSGTAAESTIFFGMLLLGHESFNFVVYTVNGNTITTDYPASNDPRCASTA